uniref:Uncharacterized protein n=1 Tax=Molossus molossus TaxID=27622 RepID=A0A7J8BKR6_MOLMO|nr:hypothetical protein HJG59_010176 [Molossus molossus]
MKYQKYLTVLQMAIGVTPSNRGSLLPLKRKLWVTPSSENPHGATPSRSQGKPSLRRIKGRVHRSKSLDSLDFCELTAVEPSPALCSLEVLLLVSGEARTGLRCGSAETGHLSSKTNTSRRKGITMRKEKMKRVQTEAKLPYTVDIFRVECPYAPRSKS